ncbi:MAG: hypothetical protein FJ126_00115 [Deltaproteobacteria bacterium]|nr:hypothetical protein [Deltaproteobacteria bacterium]
MSFQNPAFRVLRRSVAGMEGMHSKMFDPPRESPATPDLVVRPPLAVPLTAANFPFPNPVPEVMAAAGFLDRNPPRPPNTVHRSLLHGMIMPTWDNRPMDFFLMNDPTGINEAIDGSFPAPTIRAPRGCDFKCETQGSPQPPHTIHWHGFEPTPINDGVGHCSMELGRYTYQFQPNHMGSYFYHCHRNTVQHFEFGLYGFFVVDPPDAFYASIASVNPNGSVVLNNRPIGFSRPSLGFPNGSRRVAANLANFPQFNQHPSYRVPLTSPDPQGQFPTNPHAYTVHYQNEAIWVFDDRDIRWSRLAQNSAQTFPVEGTIPGVNDNFYSHGDPLVPVLPTDFFAFNDYRSTHWYVTGVNVPGPLGGTGDLPPGIVVPPYLMSGVSGVQVSINSRVNRNILVRVLNAAYNSVRVTFPVNIVIIAWDGRALGVPPFGTYNSPVLVPAGTPMEFSVARRFDCLIRESAPFSGFATVDFLDTLRGRSRRFTARIPINITA